MKYAHGNAIFANAATGLMSTSLAPYEVFDISVGIVPCR